jgi:hypothetical protein
VIFIEIAVKIKKLLKTFVFTGDVQCEIAFHVGLDGE